MPCMQAWQQILTACEGNQSAHARGFCISCRQGLLNVTAHDDCPCCLQGLEDVNTELIIMIEEGLTESFSSQGELELKATLERARHVKVPSPEARPKTRGI